MNGGGGRRLIGARTGTSTIKGSHRASPATTVALGGISGADAGAECRPQDAGDGRDHQKPPRHLHAIHARHASFIGFIGEQIPQLARRFRSHDADGSCVARAVQPWIHVGGRLAELPHETVKCVRVVLLKEA